MNARDILKRAIATTKDPLVRRWFKRLLKGDRPRKDKPKR